MKKILVIRLGPIGDTLQTTPVLRALRSSFPQSYIAMLVTTDKVDLVSENPNLNETIIYHHKRSLMLPPLIWQLRKKHFDMAVVLQPTFRLVLIAFLAGIGYRVGFRTNSGGNSLLTVAVENHLRQHEVDRYLSVLRPLGIEPVTREIEMCISDESHKWGEDFLCQKRKLKDYPLITINPGAAWPNKRWPKERYAQIADILCDKFNAEIVLTIGPLEKDLGQEIASMMRVQPIIAENLTIMQTAAIMKLSNLVISNDTGPMHIAVAVNTPTIALFGKTDRARWGPIASIHRIVHADSMDKIPVEDVLKMVEQITY